MRLASISDGLSQTIFVAERATTPFRRWGEPFHGRYGWYYTGSLADTLVTGFYPPNAARKIGLPISPAASTLHPGGLGVLMGDGSTRFIKDTIDTWLYDPATGAPVSAIHDRGGFWEDLPRPGIWQALTTHAGGEAVEIDAVHAVAQVADG